MRRSIEKAKRYHYIRPVDYLSPDPRVRDGSLSRSDFGDELLAKRTTFTGFPVLKTPLTPVKAMGISFVDQRLQEVLYFPTAWWFESVGPFNQVGSFGTLLCWLENSDEALELAANWNIKVSNLQIVSLVLSDGRDVINEIGSYGLVRIATDGPYFCFSILPVSTYGYVRNVESINILMDIKADPNASINLASSDITAFKKYFTTQSRTLISFLRSVYRRQLSTKLGGSYKYKISYESGSKVPIGGIVNSKAYWYAHVMQIMTADIDCRS